jgi:hypothetical protein
MASRSRAAGAGAGAFAAGKAARDNVYVQRLIEDEELRNSLRDAFVAARNAYSRVSHGKRPARMLIDDKKVHRDLQNAANSMRDAADSLRQGRRKRHWLRRLFVVGIIGGAVALVASEGTRKKLLDALFGAEEEFEYTSSTSPPQAPSSASNGSSAETQATTESQSEATAEKS